jgi:hypothetical protein
MTKLERTLALLPLVAEAHKKGFDIDFDLHLDHFELWHWTHGKSDDFIKFKIDRKSNYEKAFEYLTNLNKVKP